MYKAIRLVLQLRNGHGYTTRQRVQIASVYAPSIAAAPKKAVTMRIKHLAPPTTEHHQEATSNNCTTRSPKSKTKKTSNVQKSSIPTPPQEVGQGEMGYWAGGHHRARLAVQVPIQARGTVSEKKNHPAEEQLF